LAFTTSPVPVFTGLYWLHCGCALPFYTHFACLRFGFRSDTCSLHSGSLLCTFRRCYTTSLRAFARTLPYCGLLHRTLHTTGLTTLTRSRDYAPHYALPAAPPFGSLTRFRLPAHAYTLVYFLRTPSAHGPSSPFRFWFTAHSCCGCGLHYRHVHAAPGTLATPVCAVPRGLTFSAVLPTHLYRLPYRAAFLHLPFYVLYTHWFAFTPPLPAAIFFFFPHTASFPQFLLLFTAVSAPLPVHALLLDTLWFARTFAATHLRWFAHSLHRIFTSSHGWTWTFCVLPLRTAALPSLFCRVSAVLLVCVHHGRFTCHFSLHVHTRSLPFTVWFELDRFAVSAALPRACYLSGSHTAHTRPSSSFVRTPHTTSPRFPRHLRSLVHARTLRRARFTRFTTLPLRTRTLYRCRVSVLYCAGFYLFVYLALLPLHTSLLPDSIALALVSSYTRSGYAVSGFGWFSRRCFTFRFLPVWFTLFAHLRLPARFRISVRTFIFCVLVTPLCG